MFIIVSNNTSLYHAFAIMQKPVALYWLLSRYIRILSKRGTGFGWGKIIQKLVCNGTARFVAIYIPPIYLTVFIYGSSSQVIVTNHNGSQDFILTGL